jgi:hypothetical protein
MSNLKIWKLTGIYTDTARVSYGGYTGYTAADALSSLLKVIPDTSTVIKWEIEYVKVLDLDFEKDSFPSSRLDKIEADIEALKRTLIP